METETDWELINDGANLDENTAIVEEEEDEDLINYSDEDLINYSDWDDYDYDNGDLSAGFNTEPCSICLRERSTTRLRPCCQLPICQDCLTKYLESKVKEGVVAIQCPGSDCRSGFKEYEISSNVNYEVRQKFHKFLIDALNDPTLKTCPRCGQEMRVDEKELNTQRKPEARKGTGYPVTCHACALKWCFMCHAPWHEKVTCREYLLGDSTLTRWARERSPGAADQINAQKCPCCQTYIQRSEGCDSMVCTRCGSNFCYQCGTQFPTSKGRNSLLHRFFMGDHRQKLSPLGCSGLLWPRSPFPRKLLKGVVFGAKVLATILLPPLLLILALAALLVVGLAAGPVFVGVKVYRKVRPYLRQLSTAKEVFMAVLSVIGFGKVFLMCLVLFAAAVVLCLMLYLIFLVLSWLVMNLIL